MQIETSRFGTLEVDENAVITFTQPIIGFQEFRRFFLLPGSDDSPLLWLQSTESGDLAFILMVPASVLPDYRVALGASDLSELGVSSVDELDVYTLVVVPQERSKIRTNLRAPILINPRTRLGKQTILDKSDYPIRYFLNQPQEGTGSSQEVSDASTNA